MKKREEKMEKSDSRGLKFRIKRFIKPNNPQIKIKKQFTCSIKSLYYHNRIIIMNSFLIFLFFFFFLFFFRAFGSYLLVPLSDGPMQRSGHEVTSQRINLASRAHEELHHEAVAVNGSPVQRGSVGTVTVVGSRLPRDDERLDNVQVPLLGSLNDPHGSGFKLHLAD